MFNFSDSFLAMTQACLVVDQFRTAREEQWQAGTGYQLSQNPPAENEEVVLVERRKERRAEARRRMKRAA